MRDAINMWYRCRYTNNSFQFRDTCHSVHCHSSCPDRIDLSDVTPSRYPEWARWIVACLVVSVTVVSITAKVGIYCLVHLIDDACFNCLIKGCPKVLLAWQLLMIQFTSNQKHVIFSTLKLRVSRSVGQP